MRNAGPEETQAGIKIARRKINNLRYADDTTLMAESKELNSLLMKVKEKSEKVGLKLIMAVLVKQTVEPSWKGDVSQIQSPAPGRWLEKELSFRRLKIPVNQLEEKGHNRIAGSPGKIQTRLVC